MVRGTFITEANRHGRPYRATGYVCEHEQDMAECPYGDDDHRAVGAIMVAWWNNSFIQMQDRLTVRDNILRGTSN